MKTTLLNNGQNTDQNDQHDIFEVHADDSNTLLIMRQIDIIRSKL